MPNCFALTRKGDSSATPLQQVDRELCQNLELPFDELQWVCHWYDLIGFSVAMGRTLPELIDRFQKNATLHADDAEGRDHYLVLVRIAAYLNEHYSTDAWAER